MRSALGQAEERSLSTPTREARTSASPTVKEIPYDYVATFTLKGTRGNRVQDVINISVEGAFVAVTIGYSFIPARITPAPAPLTGGTPPPPSITLFGGQPVSVLPANAIDAGAFVQCLLVRLCGIDFKYSIVDSGTGRELQNQPIHNIAGLGRSDGDRPFRPLAKPMLFMPRSTIRIEIEEVSEGGLYIGAQLFIVLHGYKMLGYGGAV